MTHSFAIRRLSVGTAGALIGVAVPTDEPVIAFVSAAMTTAFWAFDAYLRQERWFRLLHNKVRSDGLRASALPKNRPDGGPSRRRS